MKAMWSSLQRLLLLVVLLGSAGSTSTVVKENDNNNLGPIPLKINLRKNALKTVSAGIHAFSQLEVVNLDKSRSITIKSISVVKEETYFDDQLVEEDLPPQLHIQRAQEVTLDPGGGTAILPITFLPRYPHNDDPEEIPPPPPISEAPPAPTLNQYQYTDLALLVGEEALQARSSGPVPRRRNNLQPNNSAYKVHSVVSVETNVGSKTAVLIVKSQRGNDYRVPYRVLFSGDRYDPVTGLAGFPGTREEAAVLLHSLHPISDADEKESVEINSSPWDCYDFYVFNPKTEPLHIVEVQVSKPAAARLFNVLQDSKLQNSTTSITDWGGERVVAPGLSDYVATVCPNRDIEGDLESNLGYLHIKTQHDTLFVLLEYHFGDEAAPAQPKRQKNKLVNSQSEAPALRAKPSSLKMDLVPYISPWHNHAISIYNPHPTMSIKIMRISLLASYDSILPIDVARIETLLMSHLTSDDEERCLLQDSDVEECNRQGIIGPQSTWKNAFELDIDARFSNETHDYIRRTDGSRRPHGRIIVTGTTQTDSSYDEWVASMKENPQNPDKVVLEIPWSVRMVDGEVFSMMEESSMPNYHLQHEFFDDIPGNMTETFLSSLFFPYEPLDLRDWTYWPGVLGRMYDYDVEGMTHKIRLLTMAHAPYNVTNMRIEADRNNPLSRVCNRFRIRHDKTARLEDQGEDGYYDLGSFRIEYNYDLYYHEFRRRGGKSAIQDVVHPLVCLLAYETEPIDTGTHYFGLVVFTGKLELSTENIKIGKNGGKGNEYHHGSTEKAPFGASLSTGFDQAYKWFESSQMGTRLLEYLRGRSPATKKSSPWKLFRQYVYKLANVTEDGTKDKEGFVEPVLMHVGAIAHGETVTMPLYLTNHNPVRVQVFVDVSEVEGISVSVSRESAHLRGDGNSVLDYFPDEIDAMFHGVGEGEWATHSREGLKEFFYSNEHAASFFNFLQHRDAIELSERAVERLPFLTSLYHKRARVNFHADLYPLNFYGEKSEGCEGDENNPSNYIDLNQTTSRDFLGPMLLSDDEHIVHSNTVCDPEFRPDISSYPRTSNMMYLKQTPVTIPPGGVVRFDIKVRAPDRESLMKDVTRFVSTGPVISTDHGQIMPIIVTFEALLGHLKLSHGPDSIEMHRRWQETPSFSHQYSGEVIEVPLSLFDKSPPGTSPTTSESSIVIPPTKELPSSPSLTTWMHPHGVSSVPLYLSSSFSRDVVLRSIESCNPWFFVELNYENGEESNDEEFRSLTDEEDSMIEIGRLRTAVSCPSMEELLEIYHEIELPEDYPSFPSFYQCALEWLENRTLLQAYGCGVSPMPSSLGDGFREEDDAIERALDALNQAITFSMFKYGNGKLRGADDSQEFDDDEMLSPSPVAASYPRDTYKSGTARSSPLVDRLTLDIFSEISDAWRVLSQLDLHSVTSNFKATIDYIYGPTKEQPGRRGRSDEEKRQSLTVSMRDVVVKTRLELPKIVESPVEPIYSSLLAQDDPFYSLLEFPPTPVGDAISVMLPLRNPTGVPVKVKLATISLEALRQDAAKAEEYHTLATDAVRDQYLNRFSPAHTQAGHDDSATKSGYGWWEGTAALFQSDRIGQVVQSKYNKTIFVEKEAGTRITCKNPSLDGNSALVVGCGPRCALRDEKPADNFTETVRRTSPIGASAAAGATMLGHSREADDESAHKQKVIYPGGYSSEEYAPPAFALPYSAFDEIVIPPYGVAEAGPIYFRPGGRFPLLGCETFLDLESAPPLDDQFGRKCIDNVFESMVLLENSLTGLERVLLRGRANWQNLIFQDLMKNGLFDDYSDMEIVNGYTTLPFPGTTVSNHNTNSSHPHPVIKAIHVQNEGDYDAEIRSVYFTDSSTIGPRKRRRRRKPKNHGCSFRGFRLLSCSEEEGSTTEGDNMNLFNGIVIPEGATYTLYIEHHPDCTFQTEFAVLNMDFERSAIRGIERNSHVFITEDGKEAEEQTGWYDTLQPKSLKLVVGYDMTDDEMKDCVPVRAFEQPVYVTGPLNVTIWNNKTNISETDELYLETAHGIGVELHEIYNLKWEPRFIWSRFVVPSMLFVGSFPLFILIILVTRFRLTRAGAFVDRVLNPKPRLETRGNVSVASSQASSPQSSWSSTFRCLARVDPTSVDLQQTIGREQVRQVVLQRYKNMGVLQPQCITKEGLFSRTSNEKAKTISETLFYQCQNTSDSSESVRCGLDWRYALGRRLIRKGDKSMISVPLKYKEYISSGLLATEIHKESKGAAYKEDRRYVDNGVDCEAVIDNVDEDVSVYAEYTEHLDKESEKIEDYEEEIRSVATDETMNSEAAVSVPALQETQVSTPDTTGAKSKAVAAETTLPSSAIQKITSSQKLSEGAEQRNTPAKPEDYISEEKPGPKKQKVTVTDNRTASKDTTTAKGKVSDKPPAGTSDTKQKAPATPKSVSKSVTTNPTAKSVSTKSATKALSSKSETKSASNKSDTNAVSTKPATKSASNKSDKKLASNKSDKKSASNKPETKSSSNKSEAKSTSKKSDSKEGLTKSETKSTSNKSETKSASNKLEIQSASNKADTKVVSIKSETKVASNKSESSKSESKSASVKSESGKSGSKSASNKAESPKSESKSASNKAESPKSESKAASNKAESPKSESKSASNKAESPKSESKSASNKAETKRPTRKSEKKPNTDNIATKPAKGSGKVSKSDKNDRRSAGKSPTPPEQANSTVTAGERTRKSSRKKQVAKDKKTEKTSKPKSAQPTTPNPRKNEVKLSPTLSKGVINVPSSPMSVQSGSTTQTESSKPLDTLGLRPPPGLAPPPGFGGMSASNTPSFGEISASNRKSISNNLNSSVNLDDLDTSGLLLPPLNPLTRTTSDADLGGSLANLGGSLADLWGASSSRMDGSSSLFRMIQQNDEQSLLAEDLMTDISGRSTSHTGTTGDDGFNLTNFLNLNDILEESERTADDSIPHSSFSALLNASVSAPTAFANKTPTNASAIDPWNTSSSGIPSSRATAYGITADSNNNESGEDDEQDRSMVVDAILTSSSQADVAMTTLVPTLLTPDALASGVSVFDDENDDRDKDNYNSGDFYARLMGDYE